MPPSSCCNPSPSSLDLDQEGPEHLLHRPAIFLEAAAPERSSSSRTAAPANLAAGDHLQTGHDAARPLSLSLLVLAISGEGMRAMGMRRQRDEVFKTNKGRDGMR